MPKKKMHKASFKFRSDCLRGVWTFFGVLDSFAFIVSYLMLRGNMVTFTVESFDPAEVTLDTMRRVAACVGDGHYILQSLNTADKYNGERYFTFYSKQNQADLYDYFSDLELPPLEDVVLIDFTKPEVQA